MAQRKDKSQAMREKILNTATQLFIQKGSEKTSMQDIAQTAGISKGAIYHHFKSKDEIVLEVMRSRQEMMEEEIKQWLKDTENLTGREQLQTILKSIWKVRQPGLRTALWVSMRRTQALF